MSKYTANSTKFVYRHVPTQLTSFVKPENKARVECSTVWISIGLCNSKNYAGFWGCYTRFVDVLNGICSQFIWLCFVQSVVPYYCWCHTNGISLKRETNNFRFLFLILQSAIIIIFLILYNNKYFKHCKAPVSDSATNVTLLVAMNSIYGHCTLITSSKGSKNK